MRYPSQHKQRTRAQILLSARRLFAAGGYAGTSIEAVMAGYGLTRGGFYRHFHSKGELYVEALADGDPSVREQARAEAESSALAAAALIVGTLALAQASGDASSRHRLLSACAQGAGRLLEPLSDPADRYFWAPD